MGGSGYMTKDTNDNTNSPGTSPTGAGAPPGATPPANVPTRFYTANGPYTGPTYAYTPQSGYTSLADQLSKAFSLSPTSLATPRTGLLPMYASPWAALYGGPSDPSFAQLWGQDPSQGTAPPPGTPAYIGQGGGANQPPSNPNPPPPPPATTPPPPGTPPPITHVPGSTYPGPGGTGGGTPGTKVFGGNHTGGFAQWMADPTGSNVGEYTNTTPTGDAPGGLLNAMRAAGLNGGAGSLLMASGLNSSNMRLGNGPMSYEQQIQGLRQGLNNRDLAGVNWKDGKWMRGNAPYVSPGNTFSGWVGAPGRKRG